VRYERQRPGELVYMDVKKIGRIPDGGGWRALGRAACETTRNRTSKLGYDYVHSLVDDHSRLAYSEIHPDEKGTTCAAFLTRALPDPRRGLLRRPRHSPDRAADDRQHLGLPMVAAQGHHRAGRPTGLHQAALPLAERQGRMAQSSAASPLVSEVGVVAAAVGGLAGTVLPARTGSAGGKGTMGASVRMGDMALCQMVAPMPPPCPPTSWFLLGLSTITLAEYCGV
jgi:hypothetical protein